MKNWSLRTKLILLSIFILIVPACIIGYSSYSISKKQLNTAGQEQLKKSTKLAIGMIDLLNEDVKAGKLSLEDAQETFREKILGPKNIHNERSLNPEYTFGETGYIFAMDSKGISIMNPTNEGQDFNSIISEDGVNLGKEFLRHEKKAGFSYYKWLNVKSKQVERKVTYVEKEPNWGWYVASGAYASEFNSPAIEVLKVIAIITAISLIVCFVIAYLFTSLYTKPIERISKALMVTADGDFTGEDIIINKDDEVGKLAKAYMKMRNNIRTLVHQVSHSTEQVAASSQQLTASAAETTHATSEINSAVQIVASGAEHSTANLHDSAQSLEEVTKAIQHLAENAAVISDTGSTVSRQAQLGHTHVKKTVDKMNVIHTKVEESSRILHILDTNSGKIDKISTVITAIADQTNLLALNAAIEAARAGEYGKGFAVVADEVRVLAEQSQKSASQISALINQIQSNMSDSSASMLEVQKEVKDGIQIVEQTETNFDEIVSAMTDMDNKVTDLASTVEQMSASAEEVSAAVSDITSVVKEASEHTKSVAILTEEQNESMGEIAAASQVLSELASDLQEQVSQFKVN